MSNEYLKVMILINNKGILVRVGDPNFFTKEIEKEILDVIRGGGQAKVVSYDDYKKMKCIKKFFK